VGWGSNDEDGNDDDDMRGMVTTADGCSDVQFISVGQTTKRAKTVNRNSHTSIRVTLVNF